MKVINSIQCLDEVTCALTKRDLSRLINPASTKSNPPQRNDIFHDTGPARRSETRLDEEKPASTIRQSPRRNKVTRSITIPLKYLCLFVLVIQTSTMVLTLRYSRKHASSSGHMYLSSTAVVLSEAIKMITCLAVLFRHAQNDVNRLSRELKDQIFDKWSDSVKLTVPAILYTVQNNLLFLALSCLDAATYQVTYQLKILTTAMFSVVMLGRNLTRLKWISLVILMLGVALVQMPSGSKNEASKKERSMSTQLMGLIAVLTACFSSGFAGVYFEKLLKGSTVSLWMRNILLACYGILFGILGVLINDFSKVKEHGFFQGYTISTWFVILLQAYGGLLVAAVVKYADNILKGFATSISIVLSSIISYYFIGDFEPSLYFMLGGTGVLTATYLYSLPTKL
eukprot:gene4721-21018_t